MNEITARSVADDDRGYCGIEGCTEPRRTVLETTTDDLPWRLELCDPHEESMSLSMSFKRAGVPAKPADWKCQTVPVLLSEDDVIALSIFMNAGLDAGAQIQRADNGTAMAVRGHRLIDQIETTLMDQLIAEAEKLDATPLLVAALRSVHTFDYVVGKVRALRPQPESCPSCKGDPATGLHAGQDVGLIKVQACQPSSRPFNVDAHPYGGDEHEAGDSSDPADDVDPGESCLTDSERNPGLTGPRDRD